MKQMTKMIPPCVAITFTFFIAFLFPSLNHGLGSASTVAITSNTDTVCGIRTGRVTFQTIVCYKQINNKIILITPNISFEVISGGQDFFCGLISGRLALLCWDPSFTHNIIYTSGSVSLRDVTVGEDHVCALTNSTGVAMCWGLTGNNSFPSLPGDVNFVSITSGAGFSCGILSSNGRRVRCWGTNSASSAEIENQFRDISMYSLVAGHSHACGFDMNGLLICRGRNDTGQLGVVPYNYPPFVFSVLALGVDYSCGIRQLDQKVVCWGGRRDDEFTSDAMKWISLETIVAGSGYTCGVATYDFSLICWGPGWINGGGGGDVYVPSFPKIGPSPCVKDKCPCRPYLDCEAFCITGCMCMRCCPKPPCPFSS